MDYRVLFGLFFVGLVSLSFSYELSPKPYYDEPISKYWPMINSICADKWGLDPYFIAAIVKAESDFNTYATNEEEKLAYESGHPMWCGEYYGKGLMQLTGPSIAGVPYPALENWEYDMPPEADPARAPYMADPYIPEQNLDRGCWYMKALYDHYSGDLYKMASAYRYGWQDVDQIDGLYVDPYNNNYVSEVMKYYNYYKNNPSETLSENSAPKTTQSASVPEEKPETKFCNALSDYLKQRRIFFFEKFYTLWGKGYFQVYCKNVFYPLVSKNPKKLKKIQTIIGMQ